MIYKDFIFIHIPKTGGSSIRSSLNKNYELIYNATEKNLKKLGYLNLNENFENYDFKIYNFIDHLPYPLIKKKNYDINKYKFTFIRNPFSRVVSLYFECMANNFHLEGLKTNKKIGFEEFVEIITKKPYWFTLPMIDYIGIKNINDIDFIGRFENFENDLLKLKKKIKISIKHHNFNNHIPSKMKFSDYSPFYSNKKIIEKIYFYYEKDFDYFKYTYEDFLKFENKKVKLSTIFMRLIKRKFVNLT
tara:strand:+ start:629 stop:1366 length:738 start_codon:yes stop_codon:yes gene_type:complete